MDPIDLPEMWTTQSIINAVHAGHTFLIPFDYRKLFQANAYYIGGIQYSASGVTVGPHHTPDIVLTPEGNIQMTLYFERGMVKEKDFYRPPEQREGRWIGPVHAFIMPEDIDWEGLNRGQQFRVPKGTIRRNPYRRNSDESLRDVWRNMKSSPSQLNVDVMVHKLIKVGKICCFPGCTNTPSRNADGHFTDAICNNCLSLYCNTHSYASRPCLACDSYFNDLHQAHKEDEWTHRTTIINYLINAGRKCASPGGCDQLPKLFDRPHSAYEIVYCVACRKIFCDGHAWRLIGCDDCGKWFCCPGSKCEFCRDDRTFCDRNDLFII